MADDSVLSAPVGTGDTIRDLVDALPRKWPACVPAYVTHLSTDGGVSDPNVLQLVTPAEGLPVQPATGSSWAVTINSGQAVGVTGTATVVVAGTATVAGAVTMVDGGSATIGAKGDAAVTNPASAASVVALLKGLLTQLAAQLPAALTGSGNLKVAISEDSITAPVNTTQLGGTAISVNTGNADNGTARVVLASNQPAVNVTETNLDGSIVAWAGTAAPSKGVGIIGKTNDGTPQYQPIPEGPGGRTVIVEGYAGGVEVPCNLTKVGGTALSLGQQLAAGSLPIVLTAAQLTTLTPLSTVTANQGGAPWSSNLTQVAGNAIATGNGATSAGTVRVTLSSDSTGQVVLAAGTAIVGKVGIDQTTPGTTNGVTPVGATSGSLTRARIKAASGTNATSVKASAGQLYGLRLGNNTSSARYLKLYDKASAPTVGTDTPAWTEIIPPTQGGVVYEWSLGIPFTTGIAYAITTGVADSDTGACTADDVHGVMTYK